MVPGTKQVLEEHSFTSLQLDKLGAGIQLGKIPMAGVWEQK